MNTIIGPRDTGIKRLNNLSKLLAENPTYPQLLTMIAMEIDSISPMIMEKRNLLSIFNQSISDLQRIPAIFPGSINPDLGLFLYSLIATFNVKNVIEVGTLFGYSTLCMAEGIKRNNGHIHSFDLFLRENYSAFPEVSSGVQFVTDLLESCNLKKYVTLHPGDSKITMDCFFSDTPDYRADLVFLDGSHLIRDTIADFKLVDAIMSVGGVIVFHDTSPDRSGWVGPRFVLDKLPPDTYQTIDLPTSDGLGIAIIQKVKNGITDIVIQPKLRHLIYEELLFHRHFRKRVKLSSIVRKSKALLSNCLARTFRGPKH